MENIAPGTYVVAVSGGVDSMALLHMLQQRPGLTLVVAHVDHGIRSDSAKDLHLVKATAKKYGLVCESTTLTLGDHPSEEAARNARYNFLQQCSKKHNAEGIITAHHQDDLIETAIIALMRGTGWRGLAPFSGKSMILRPLLKRTKDQLIGYARRHGITWHEDATNSDESYLRNYVRRSLVPMLDQKSLTWRDDFLQHIRKQQTLRQTIAEELKMWLKTNTSITVGRHIVPRYSITMLPANVAYELLQQVFRNNLGNSLPRQLAESAVLFTKVAKPHKLMVLGHNWQLRAESANVIVEHRPTVLSLSKQ